MRSHITVLLSATFLFALSTSRNCPEIYEECTCDLSSDNIRIECIFEEVLNLTQTLLFNSTVSDLHIDSLILDSNNLTSLPVTFLSGVASVGVFSLKDNDLRNIPETLSDIMNVTVLDMSFNKIQTLNLSLWNLSNIQHATFAFNQIDLIELPTNPQMVTSLNLSQNYLQMVPEALWSMGTYLDLSYNNIQKLPRLPISYLEVLNLSNNKITSIEPHTFDNAKNLHELNLRDNKITKIDMQSFSGLDVLDKLILDDNKLSFLDGKVFSEMPFLKTLSLADNKLTSIDPVAFTGIDDSLQQLILRNNHLGNMTNNTFKNLKNLRFLDLSFNSDITNINHLEFPSHLAHIDLQNCSITNVKSCKFIEMNDLQVLNLDYNKLQCSCHLSVLFAWLKDRKMHGFSAKAISDIKWTCTGKETGKTYIVNENVKDCGRYQDIEPHCEEFKTVVSYDFAPVEINMTILTSENLIIISWDVQGDIREIIGFKVLYESSGNVLFESPILDNNQRTFVISFESSKDQYKFCVDAIGNSSVVLDKVCKSFSNQSLDYLIGILAGFMLLVPCMAALIYILRKDQIIKQKEYAKLAENADKSKPSQDSVVVEVNETNKIDVETAVCPYHENKAFSETEEVSKPVSIQTDEPSTDTVKDNSVVKGSTDTDKIETTDSTNM